jgi:pimeloyl-ACP methyl ester carboxylesterase
MFTMTIPVACLLSTIWIASASLSPAFVSARRRINVLSSQQQLHTSSYLDSLATQQKLRTLYPSTEPIKEDSIQVSSLHTLKYQVYGNPDGLPALFLHGGPGAGCFPNHARFFDPDKYCIVLLNQRGANEIGKGETRENTLLDLVNDCEVLRQHLNMSAWSVLLGGSWGTTLALAYAQEHPDRIKSMILRGICLLRPKEVNWLLGQDGVATLDPTGFQDFCHAINATSSKHVLEQYYHRLFSDNSLQRLEAAKGWMKWEMRVSLLQQDEKDSKAPVLVGRRGLWEYQDGSGKDWIHDTLEPPTILLKHLQRNVPDRFRYTQETVLPIQAVPVLPSIRNMSLEESAKFVPCQAMLTCFYSVNHDYCLNHIDLLSSDRMMKVQSIPSIAIHGGLDTICPVNNAMDLCQAWPGLEVRVCTKAGHSMYDDAITNELIHATDRLAKLWEVSATGIFE